MKLKHITKIDQIQSTVWHNVRSYNIFNSLDFIIYDMPYPVIYSITTQIYYKVRTQIRTIISSIIIHQIYETKPN
jgi:hypothetical protein